MKLSVKIIKEYSNYLCREEKSAATQEKYLRDVRAFFAYADSGEIIKELVVAWKKQLVENGYAVRTINSMLASINSLLDFLGLQHCKVKNIRFQRQTYCAEDKELTKAEYLRLLSASKKNEQLNLVLQTICGTGICFSPQLSFTPVLLCKSHNDCLCLSPRSKILHNADYVAIVTSSKCMHT